MRNSWGTYQHYISQLETHLTVLSLSDVRYISKYRDTPGVSGYDTAMLVYRYFYKFKFCTI